MTYSATVLADSPIAYYRLGEASGTTMTDSSGNARDGTYSGSPTLGTTGLIAGDPDTAVTWSGQSASVTDDNAYDGLSAFTVEAWINPTSVTGARQVVNRDGGTNRAWQFRVNVGKVEFLKIAGGVVTASSSTTLTTGVTRHVAAVYNGTDIRIYIDGVLDGTPAAATGTLGTVARNLELAVRSGSDLFAGVMDEVATYGTALTSTRIAAHYAAGIAGAGITISGEVFTSATTMLDGSALTAISVAGEVFTSAVTMLDGGPLIPITVAGEQFVSTVTMLDGVIAGGPIAGEAFTSAVVMLDGGVVGSGITVAGEAFIVGVVMLDGSLVYQTDTSNAFDGLDFGFAATVTVTHPVASAPPALVPAAKVDKAVAYPVPTMVNGRPT